MAESTEQPLVTSEFFKRNINGKWEDVEVTADEIRKLKKEVSQQNAAILKGLKERYKGEFSETEILALFDKLSQHYRYHAESYVDAELGKTAKK